MEANDVCPMCIAYLHGRVIAVRYGGLQHPFRRSAKYSRTLLQVYTLQHRV